MAFLSMIHKPFSAFVFALLVCTSCNSQPAVVKNLSPAEFEKAIAQPEAQLIDVRTPEEYSEKHIPQSTNLNYNAADFKEQLGKLDKNKPVYFYCLVGGRSKKAADMAASAGFKEVYNLEFGINSWIAEKKDVVSSKNTQAPGVGITFDDYLARIKNNNKLVLVDFNAVWCGPCKTLKPILHKLMKKNGDKLELLEIDVDKNSTVANTMNVRSIPLLILYKQGKEVWRTLGLVDESLLQKQVDLYK